MSIRRREILQQGRKKFYCSGDEAIHKIVVSSDDYPELKGSNSYQKISQIRLYWGCIAEDTQILMADGSVKRADGIAIGDKILDRDGNTLCANGMVTGSYTEQGKIADQLSTVRDRRDEIDAAAAAEVKRLREDDTAGRIFA